MYAGTERSKVTWIGRANPGLPALAGMTTLVKRASQGDRTSFDRLMVTYNAALKGFVAFRVSAPEVDDVVQEIWMTCWSRLPQLKNQKSFKAWLYGIAVNKCYEAHRGRTRNPQTSPLEDSANVASDEMPIDESIVLHDTVRRTLLTLPLEQRDVIELYYYSQLTLPEIADALQRNLNTVKYQFYRGHDVMAVTLKKKVTPANAGLKGRPPNDLPRTRSIATAPESQRPWAGRKTWAAGAPANVPHLSRNARHTWRRIKRLPAIAGAWPPYRDWRDTNHALRRHRGCRSSARLRSGRALPSASAKGDIPANRVRSLRARSWLVVPDGALRTSSSTSLRQRQIVA